MKVITVSCLKDNFSYIVINEKNNNACVIDPSEAEPIVKVIKNNNLNLKCILNTHHHGDHVGGNLKLKKEFKCNIFGYIKDKNKIPGIDIFLKDKDLFKNEDFEFKTYHTPGHTLGHVIFHFHKQDFLFTGDTLFSLGCGRIFEGTKLQMYESINLIKNFPTKTKIFFGHEYTKQNSKFCAYYDPTNKKLMDKIVEIDNKLNSNLSTTPTILADEIDCNIFLRTESLSSFSKLRELKDNF